MLRKREQTKEEEIQATYIFLFASRGYINCSTLIVPCEWVLVSYLANILRNNKSKYKRVLVCPALPRSKPKVKKHPSYLANWIATYAHERRQSRDNILTSISGPSGTSGHRSACLHSHEPFAITKQCITNPDRYRRAQIHPAELTIGIAKRKPSPKSPSGSFSRHGRGGGALAHTMHAHKLFLFFSLSLSPGLHLPGMIPTCRIYDTLVSCPR